MFNQQFYNILVFKLRVTAKNGAKKMTVVSHVQFQNAQWAIYIIILKQVLVEDG